MNNDILEKHLDLVIAANEITNITRITSREEARILHIEDSLGGLDLVNRAPKGRYGDIGSGAGYPGIPIAIETQRKTVLIESIGKKASILQGFITELGMESYVTVYSGRAEDLARSQPSSFAVLTARAVSKLSCLMELASPLLAKEGLLICYKANPDEEELQHALELQDTLGMKYLMEKEFTLSDNVTHRKLIVFEKISKSKVHLPRKNGFAQKKPL